MMDRQVLACAEGSRDGSTAGSGVAAPSAVRAAFEERVVALPCPEEKCQGQSDDETGKSVSCMSVSPCGRLLAVCDERKQVCVLTLPDFR